MLGLLGIGVGFFTPANQKVAFASVAKDDYGVLAAMLSSFGTAAGTIGTTIAVALMEMKAKEICGPPKQFLPAHSNLRLRVWCRLGY